MLATLLSFAVSSLLQSGVPQDSTQRPERVAVGNTVESRANPRITLEIRQPVQYVGAARWVLYGVADCEVHVFVEADGNKRVTRLYWIQFEGYLPTVPHKYDGYTSPIRAQIGGREFIVDGSLMRTASPPRAGSDRERVFELIATKGYVLPPEMMTRRMVHLPDADLRRELMIIYAEDLAPTGLGIEDLQRGGRAEGHWPQLGAELLTRATERISAR